MVIECHPGSSLVQGVPVGVGWSVHGDLAITQPRRCGVSKPQMMTRVSLRLEELVYHLEEPAPVHAQLARLEHRSVVS